MRAARDLLWLRPDCVTLPHRLQELLNPVLVEEDPGHPWLDGLEHSAGAEGDDWLACRLGLDRGDPKVFCAGYTEGPAGLHQFGNGGVAGGSMEAHRGTGAFLQVRQ